MDGSCFNARMKYLQQWQQEKLSGAASAYQHASLGSWKTPLGCHGCLYGRLCCLPGLPVCPGPGLASSVITLTNSDEDGVILSEVVNQGKPLGHDAGVLDENGWPRRCCMSALCTPEENLM